MCFLFGNMFLVFFQTSHISFYWQDCTDSLVGKPVSDSPLLPYAAETWGHHASGKSEETCHKEMILGFLRKRPNVACVPSASSGHLGGIL
jgi:hypothetical protein